MRFVKTAVFTAYFTFFGACAQTHDRGNPDTHDASISDSDANHLMCASGGPVSIAIDSSSPAGCTSLLNAIDIPIQLADVRDVPAFDGLQLHLLVNGIDFDIACDVNISGIGAHSFALRRIGPVSSVSLVMHATTSSLTLSWMPGGPACAGCGMGAPQLVFAAFDGFLNNGIFSDFTGETPQMQNVTISDVGQICPADDGPVQPGWIVTAHALSMNVAPSTASVTATPIETVSESADNLSFRVLHAGGYVCPSGSCNDGTPPARATFAWAIWMTDTQPLFLGGASAPPRL